MNWIKSIFSRKQKKEPEPTEEPMDPKLQEAYEMGQKAAKEMEEDLDAFLAQRYTGLHDRYLGVFQDGLNLAKASTEYSPIIEGRVEYQLFRENVEELIEKMATEIDAQMAAWHEWDREIEMDGITSELITAKVKKITDNLTFAGLGLFLDNAEDLKEADDAWREAHPKLAAEQPLDEKEE